MAILEEIAAALVDYDKQTTLRLVKQALEQGVPARQVLEQGLLVGMTEVGRRFREGEYFVPEVLVAAEAMKAGNALLKPQLARQGVKPMATAVIGTVRGDLHDIGKNLLRTMLEGAGFEVVDLGVDVSPETFVEACRERTVHLVGLSALLTTTMPAMRDVVGQLRENLSPTPVVLIGGAPVSEEYAREIGADAYGRDAATGAELAKQLCLGLAS